MGRRRLLPVSSSLVAGVSGQRRTLSRLGASKLFRFRFFFRGQGHDNISNYAMRERERWRMDRRGCSESAHERQKRR